MYNTGKGLPTSRRNRNLGLNSRFHNMFLIGRDDIDNQYKNTLRQIERNKQKSLQKFMKSSDYVKGTNTPGMAQINTAFDEQFAQAKQNYQDQMDQYKMSLRQRQAGEAHNSMFGKKDF